MIQATVHLGPHEWEREFTDEASVKAFLSYLSDLETFLPTKLRKAVGSYAQVCQTEALCISIPDAQWFQALVEGHKFSVQTKGNPQNGNPRESQPSDFIPQPGSQSGRTLQPGPIEPNSLGPNSASDASSVQPRAVPPQGTQQAGAGQTRKQKDS